MWIRVAVAVVVVVVAAYASMSIYGARHWDSMTRELRERLGAARKPLQPHYVTFAELPALPAPVQRYFRKVLKDGQPMVAGVRVRHIGTFNQSETADEWKPFTSDQQVVAQRPGFDWNATIRMMPGLPVRVHDAYIAGEGILHAAVFGLFPVANMRDRHEAARGELMRFAAEAAWYPTALLPSQGIQWERVDDRSAIGTLKEGPLHVTLLFTFTGDDLIESVRANARGRVVGREIVQTPWQGRLWNYEERNGMLVPLDGEVAWLLPAGARPYWRGHIEETVYEFAER
ncbi:MAG: hypothetical protein EHM55_13525 [Acidobacteria bacterium]|nr:MAG: hypothetical protein EHM55_13525 [Acidobacteriota bacterium]